MQFSKNKAKIITKLHRTKGRKDAGVFLAEGPKVVEEALAYPDLLEEIWGTEDWIRQHTDTMKAAQIVHGVVTEQELKSISTLSTPNQVLAIVRFIPPVDIDTLHGESLLYLDGIQDPGNMGTILRIADWFGIKGVVCAPDCVDVFHPKVVQSTMGAMFRVPTMVVAPQDLKTFFPKHLFLGADMSGDNIFSTKVPNPWILIIGNEGNGIRAHFKGIIDQTIRIPAPTEASAESLNAAVATGIMVATLSAVKLSSL